MSTSRSSLRHRTLAISALVAGAALAPLPAALAWPPGTCEPGKDKNCAVDVAIAKASDRDAYAPGDVVTYTITVTNTGNTAVDRSRIRVSDPALADLAPAGATTGWLSPGETLVWTGTRAVTAAECGELPNTATVSLTKGKYWGGDDVNPGNDTATRTVVVAGEACAPPAPPTPPAPPVVPVAQSPAVVAPPTKPAAGPVCPRPTLKAVVRGAKHPTAGGTVKYRVTVRTTGVTARKVTLRLRLPAGVSLRGANAAQLRRGDLVVRVGTLKRGTPRTVAVTLRLDRSARGAKTLRASVTARCGGAAATARTIQAVAAAPARVQPAVTG
jgi:uncharacterized repeat protein (TIGR01451 family)